MPCSLQCVLIAFIFKKAANTASLFAVAHLFDVIALFLWSYIVKFRGTFVLAMISKIPTASKCKPWIFEGLIVGLIDRLYSWYPATCCTKLEIKTIGNLRAMDWISVNGKYGLSSAQISRTELLSVDDSWSVPVHLLSISFWMASCEMASFRILVQNEASC